MIEVAGLNLLIKSTTIRKNPIDIQLRTSKNTC